MPRDELLTPDQVRAVEQLHHRSLTLEQIATIVRVPADRITRSFRVRARDEVRNWGVVRLVPMADDD